MRYSRLTVVLIATLALSSTGCSVQRQASSSEREAQLRLKSVELRVDRDSAVAEVRDTITITKTVTVDRNDKGDTLRIATETDRYRGHDVQKLRVKHENVNVVRDTVYIEKRDSVFVSSKQGKNPVSSRLTAFGSVLKLLIGLIASIIVLLITWKVVANNKQ